MNLIAVVLVLILLAAVLLVISAPLRPPAGHDSHPPGEEPAGESPGAFAERERREHEREQLEAAREAKYREIRDVELDYRTGKLSRADYEAIDGSLRAEAIEILRRLGEEDDEDAERE